MESTFYLQFHALCKERRRSPNSVAAELGIPSGSVTAWKRGASPRSKAAGKIAEYFGVTTAWLYGQPEPTEAHRELKFALFGGDGEVTDAMLEEVLQFAQFVKQRQTRKKE